MSTYRIDVCYHSTLSSGLDGWEPEKPFYIAGLEYDDLSTNGQIIDVQINPQLPFWKRAVREFDELSKQNSQRTFDRIAPIISDLGQSLSMLFGRNWHSELKIKWELKYGHVPSTSKTPPLMALIEKYYPQTAGWDLKNENRKLFDALKFFIEEKYYNLVKHLEEELLREALSITYDHLRSYMEIVRQTWVWFIEKHTGRIYSTDDPAFSDFTRKFV